MPNHPNKPLVVVGGGPAGLMAAEILASAGMPVALYEAMPSVGRKFLLAGKGGLNITNSAPIESFCSRYGNAGSFFRKCFTSFSADSLCHWLADMGIETFVGSSGRVFPTSASAARILAILRDRLVGLGVAIRCGHRWHDLTADNKLVFTLPNGETGIVSPSAVILALGGESRPQTGSDGKWTSILSRKGIRITQFMPANCGFDKPWSPHFLAKHEGAPLKNMVLSCASGQTSSGDIVVTRHGLEGGGLYSLTPVLREEIVRTGEATLFLDLKRDLDQKTVLARLSRERRKDSLTNFLRKTLRLDKVCCALLRETLRQEQLEDISLLAGSIKRLPLKLTAIRPIAEAISSAGGIDMTEINDSLMLKKMPGFFVAGEMLDWEAPTGGFLLQGAFSTGYCAAKGVLRWLDQQQIRESENTNIP